MVWIIPGKGWKWTHSKSKTEDRCCIIKTMHHFKGGVINLHMSGIKHSQRTVSVITAAVHSLIYLARINSLIRSHQLKKKRLIRNTHTHSLIIIYLLFTKPHTHTDRHPDTHTDTPTDRHTHTCRASLWAVGCRRCSDTHMWLFCGDSSERRAADLLLTNPTPSHTDLLFNTHTQTVWCSSDTHTFTLSTQKNTKKRELPVDTSKASDG